LSFEIIDANTVFGPWPMVRADMPAERLATALKSHGVSASLAISTIGALHNHSDGNVETLRICSEVRTLLPVATIDPRGYFGPASVVTALAEQGFKMFRFFPLLQDWSLDHAAFGDVLDAIEMVGKPVMVQARQTGCPSAMARSVGSRTIPIILEGISYENMAEAVSVMRNKPNFFVDTRELRVPGALRFLVDQVGAERVVFGSGCLRNSLASALGYITDSEIGDEAKAAIFGGNIKRLLGG
jgi:predicted TIM-barrel fold metal-dependent hydrolase